MASDVDDDQQQHQNLNTKWCFSRGWDVDRAHVQSRSTSSLTGRLHKELGTNNLTRKFHKEHLEMGATKIQLGLGLELKRSYGWNVVVVEMLNNLNQDAALWYFLSAYADATFDLMFHRYKVECDFLKLLEELQKDLRDKTLVEVAQSKEQRVRMRPFKKVCLKKEVNRSSTGKIDTWEVVLSQFFKAAMLTGMQCWQLLLPWGKAVDFHCWTWLLLFHRYIQGYWILLHLEITSDASKFTLLVMATGKDTYQKLSMGSRNQALLLMRFCIG